VKGVQVVHILLPGSPSPELLASGETFVIDILSHPAIFCLMRREE
jgi:hypothetical protein